MRTLKLISLFAAASASLPLRAQPASPAAAPADPGANRPRYAAHVKHVAGPGLMPADYGYATFGTNQFGFVMPAGFRLETQDAQKVTLVSADFNCLLTFRVVEPLPPGVTALDPAPYRALVLSRRRGGKIIAEFSQAAASRRGPGFDVRWNADGTVPRHEHVLFVPSDAGVLEFALVSSPERFETGRQAFNTLVLTFRAAEADGRLVMPVLSNRI
jgi:hypothetical protein